MGKWVGRGRGLAPCFLRKRPPEMDRTSNAKRPAALKTSVALGTVGFFSPEMFLQLQNEALPT